jgi:Protein of unknown function (DUF3237)
MAGDERDCAMTKLVPPSLHHLATVRALVEAPRELARIPAGTREMIAITGGTAEGRINGRILPGGADWAINHGDGTATIWARYAIERDDGSLIMVTNAGYVTEQPDGSWRGHTVPQLEAGAGDLTWLHTTILIGTLHATESLVELVWWQVG